MDTLSRPASLDLNSLVIRPAVETDLPDLEWEGDLLHFRRVFAHAFELVAAGRAQIWLALLPPVGLVGQLFIQFICDRLELADGSQRAYLYSFRVKPAYRSKGVGSAMMERVEADLRSRGFQRVTLTVARENQRARELYQKRGYLVTATDPGRWRYPDHLGVWHEVEEPAWRMEKDLLIRPPDWRA